MVIHKQAIEKISASKTRKQQEAPRDFVYVVVNFLFQLIFIFPLFWGMVMYANDFKTKEKQKLTEIKNSLQHLHTIVYLSFTCILDF